MRNTGDELATTGSTGITSTPHSHCERRINPSIAKKCKHAASISLLSPCRAEEGSGGLGVQRRREAAQQVTEKDLREEHMQRAKAKRGRREVLFDRKRG